jgi:hypothetical protein
MKHSELDRAEAALREPQPQAMTKLVSTGVSLAFMVGLPSGTFVIY